MERGDVIRLLRRYGKLDQEIRGLDRMELGEQEADNYRSLLVGAKREISQALMALPYEQRDAVFSHYCRGQQWVQIRWRHNYSDRQIRNISNRGLQALGEKLERCGCALELLRQNNL